MCFNHFLWYDFIALCSRMNSYLSRYRNITKINFKISDNFIEMTKSFTYLSQFNFLLKISIIKAAYSLKTIGLTATQDSYQKLSIMHVSHGHFYAVIVVSIVG